MDRRTTIFGGVVLVGLSATKLSCQQATSVLTPEASSTPGGGVAVIVRLSQPAPNTMYVAYKTITGGANPALAGKDFRPTNGVLVFAPGQLARSFEIEVVGSPVGKTMVAVLTPTAGFNWPPSLTFPLTLGMRLPSLLASEHDVARPAIIGGARASRRLIWDADLSEKSLLAATASGRMPNGRPGWRSRFPWGNRQTNELGAYFGPGEIRGYQPFSVRAGRAVLQAAEIDKTAVRDGAVSWGQALLCSDQIYMFRRGDLIEHDFRVEQPIGLWGAFWTGSTAWPKGGELDSPEIRPDWRGAPNFNMHYQGSKGEHRQTGGLVPMQSLVKGWASTGSHAYELEWTHDDRIIHRVDGLEVMNEAMSWNGAEHYLLIQAAATNFGGTPKPETPPAVSIGYIRAFR